ncbi:predicted protein [Naegleria gruberi]|uniref:Predicted protein n=1 Tax=Naegleria gruberi TaxID=5762 RepID=D2V0W9_NAEGR|nr:uncharacterized protein NAEGRDRAFT_78081 [Naegleria gruberi]EFC49588.1 predicted protein [Naegleria gruberi]|eukprot:XP_002682332.1 predicted protein [Naegleria gruberi strain NEG-M]
MLSQLETLPNEIILHILHYIDDNECFHSTCFTKKYWLLTIWPYRKEKLAINSYSDLDRYLQNVSNNTNNKVSSAKNSTIGSVVGAINASSRATHIEEKKISTKILYDYFDRFTHLKEISLVNCGLNDSSLEKLCSINKRGLISLNISKNKNLTWANTQKCIMLCENIKSLDISYNFQASTPNQNTQNTWIESLTLPMSLERLNISGFLSEIPDFESLFKLIKKFSKENQETEHPIIKVFTANHLTEFSLLKPEYLKTLRELSKKTMIEMYNHCFIFLKSLTFVEIYTSLGFYPATELINECIIKGHTRSLELLASIDFPFNEISLGVLEEAILAGHSSIISKLRVLGFTRFDDISDDLLDKLVTKGDAAAITELRSCNVPRRKWDLITLSAVETAVRNGNKDVLEHIRMLNLGDLLKQVAIEHVEYALERGHSGILKQLTSCNYQYLNDINAQILANIVAKSVTFEIVLRNAGYKNLTEIKSLIKQQTNTKPEKKAKKESKKEKKKTTTTATSSK